MLRKPIWPRLRGRLTFGIGCHDRVLENDQIVWRQFVADRREMQLEVGVNLGRFGADKGHGLRAGGGGWTASTQKPVQSVALPI